MLRHRQLEHRFVTHIPDRLEPGVIYISMEYATAAHSCCCGCGEEVVTPITPKDWSLTFDGETISLSPSIGNWNFTCRSHYFIKGNRIVDAFTWKQSRAFDNSRTDSSETPSNSETTDDKKESSHENHIFSFWEKFRPKRKKKKH